MNPSLPNRPAPSYSEKDDIRRSIRHDLRLNSNALAVADTILEHINRESGYAWPGVDRIAEESGLSKKTAERQIKALKEAGYLDYVKGNGRTHSNHYFFVFDIAESAEIIPLEAEERASNEGRKSVNRDPVKDKKGDNYSSKGRQTGSVKGDKTSPLTNIITNKKNQSGLTQKYTYEELQQLAWSCIHDPIQPIPADISAPCVVDRSSEFWVDWLFYIHNRHANAVEARRIVQSIVERGWLPAPTPYPKLIQGTPRAKAYDARQVEGLSGDACGSFRA